jgi:NADH:ubiquinone reductase (H+-translocating)
MTAPVASASPRQEAPRVVIVGAGFGGISAARALATQPVHVTIVDQHNFHTFSPLLYQVATAGLAPDDIAPNLRGIVQDDGNIETHLGKVERIDFDRREVFVDEGPPLPYDYLVLAAGAVSSDFGVPGVAEHSFPLKTLADATRLRTTVLCRFEAANVMPSLIDDGGLTFVVAGGGPTGVELSGALAELFAKVLAKDFKRLDVSRAKVILVEMTDHLLGGFSAKSQLEAVTELERRGVDVRLETSIAAVRADAVELKNGTEIATHTVIWAAGVKANPIAATLGLETSKRGELEVGADLSVAGRPEVFVIGDLAAATDRKGRPYPQLAPVALQAGRHTARNIERRLGGKPTRAFHYVDKGIMATIGRRSAVAELPFHIRFWGTLGWLSWLGLHLVFLIGFRNRVVVLVNWTFNYFKWDRGHRLIEPDTG